MHILRAIILSMIIVSVSSLAIAWNDNDVIATVNGKKITIADYIDYLKKTNRQDEISSVLDDKENIYMSYFIFSLLESHEAYRLGLCDNFGHFQKECIDSYEQTIKKETAAMVGNDEKLRKYFDENYDYIWEVDESRVDYILFDNMYDAKTAISLAKEENACLLSENAKLQIKAVIAGANIYKKIGTNKYQLSTDVMRLSIRDISTWIKYNNGNFNYKEFDLSKELTDTPEFNSGEIIGPLESLRGYYILCMSLLPAVDHVNFDDFKKMLTAEPNRYFLVIAVRKLVDKANIDTKYNLAGSLKKKGNL